MPELDGYGVLRAMKNNPDLDDTPFVFFTGDTEKADFRKAMDLGADDFITKPFEGDDLLRIAENKLKKKAQQKTKAEDSLERISSFLNDTLSLDEIIDLSADRTVKKIKNKYPVYSDGDSASNLFFVVTGKIKTYKTNESGKEFITNIHNPGDFFGYTAILDNSGIHKQSAVAIENSEVSVVPKQDFYSLLYYNRDVSMKFIRFISNNIIESEEKLLKLAYNSARKKVADTLVFLYKQFQREGKTDHAFHVNRDNLSAIAGISPESISRNLADFREEGLIESESGVIRIMNIKKLETLRD
jgi:CRP-like cAMP-binding protein